MLEERMQVLKMIQEKKITAEEGAKLLAALKRSRAPKAPGAPGAAEVPMARPGRWLHVRVTDLCTGRSKVSVNIPLNLVDVGLRLGARFGPADFDMDEVVKAIKSGTAGKIVEMEDEAKGERVEIYVE
jgi:hypothetical protein